MPHAESANGASDMEAPLLHGSAKAWDLRTTLAMPLIAMCVGITVTFLFLTEFVAEEAHVDQYYDFFIHVMLMVFVGFGFLMTFLKRYSSSAVGLNYLLSGVVMLLAVLCVGAAQQGLFTGLTKVIKIDLPLLIDSAYCSGSAMIAFGAVLGRASPGQLLAMLSLMVPLYAANAWFVTEYMEVLDIGGSITIHAFGAYYGLAVSYFMSGPKIGSGHAKNGANPFSDITAMIGTVFLWVLWPSFNGALSIAPGETDLRQFACIGNTAIALLAACLSAFATSALLTNKMDMVHVQNATLAGGVAIGTAANLRLPPAASLAVGMVAGVLSVVGYFMASPLLESKLGLNDTCGVHNLHGMPGVLGGLAAALFTALPALHPGNKHLYAHGSMQPLWQLAGLGFTLAVALVAGALVGLLVTKVDPAKQKVPSEMMYDDKMFWHMEEEEHDK